MEKVFGLIGSTVSHSFSKSYFDEKFFREGLRDHRADIRVHTVRINHQRWCGDVARVGERIGRRVRREHHRIRAVRHRGVGLVWHMVSPGRGWR